MTVNRFMVILENGNIAFRKVTTTNRSHEVETIREYAKTTQTTLDFAREALARLENEFPEWAEVLTWEMMAEEDFEDEYKEEGE